jgi:phage tail tape-measure protein
VGAAVGVAVGPAVGVAVGVEVGIAVGDDVGVAVGKIAKKPRPFVYLSRSTKPMAVI